MPSPEQDEENPPYPPAKKGDKPGALAQMLRDSLLAGWILPVLAPGFFLEETGSWQGSAREGRGQIQHQKLLLSPTSLPPPLSH